MKIIYTENELPKLKKILVSLGEDTKTIDAKAEEFGIKPKTDQEIKQELSKDLIKK